MQILQTDIDDKAWYQSEQRRVEEWLCDVKLMVCSIIVVNLWQLKYNILQQRLPEQCIVKLYHNNSGQSVKLLWQWPEDLLKIPSIMPPVSTSIPQEKGTEWILKNRLNGKRHSIFFIWYISHLCNSINWLISRFCIENIEKFWCWFLPSLTLVRACQLLLDDIVPLPPPPPTNQLVLTRPREYENAPTLSN